MWRAQSIILYLPFVMTLLSSVRGRDWKMPVAYVMAPIRVLLAPGMKNCTVLMSDDTALWKLTFLTLLEPSSTKMTSSCLSQTATTTSYVKTLFPSTNNIDTQAGFFFFFLYYDDKSASACWCGNTCDIQIMMLCCICVSAVRVILDIECDFKKITYVWVCVK